MNAAPLLTGGLVALVERVPVDVDVAVTDFAFVDFALVDVGLLRAVVDAAAIAPS